MSRKRRTSLETKIVTLMVGAIFAVLLGVSYIILTSQEKAIYEARIQQFNNTAQALALTAEPLIDDKDSHLSDMLTQRLKNARWELAYIVMADDRGQTLFASSRTVPPQKDTVGKELWRVARRLGISGVNGSDNTYPVTIPIRIAENRWGTFCAGFSLSGLQETQEDLRSLILLTFAGAMILGVICAIAFARGLSSSIRTLTKGAHAVAQGDFSYRIPQQTSDEIGELVDTYNYMIDALSRSHEQLLERANADSLTGLYNHRYFQERLTDECNRSERYGHTVSLLMIDVDKFKSFNDEHGHPLGDRVLCDVSTIMIESLREIDIAARYGGEEFVVILPETSGEEATRVAERLRKAVEKHRFRGKDNAIVPVTISIGVASYPANAQGRDQLLRAADVALYKAKSDGRNAVRSYTNDSSSGSLADPYKLYVLLHANDMKTVEALAGAIDAKHRLPVGYSTTLAAAAVELAENLGMSEDGKAAVYLASLLRDVGQIAVPDAVLSKNEPFDQLDRSVIEQHPVLGHSIIQKASHFQSVLPAVLHHHERFDGTGYPYGLSGKDIPLEARIIAVVDAYQSMTSARPHRPPMTPGEAQMELTKLAGKQFDPEIVEAFIKVINDKQKAA